MARRSPPLVQTLAHLAASGHRRSPSRRGTRSAALVAAMVAVCGCRHPGAHRASSRAAAAPAPAPAPPPPPTRIAPFTRTSIAGPCRFGPPTSLGPVAPRAELRVGAATGPVALVAVALDASHVRVRPLNADGTPSGSPVTVEIAAGTRPIAVAGFGVDHFLLLTDDECPDDAQDYCLYARWLARDGHPVGPVATDRLPDGVDEMHFVEQPGGLVMYQGFGDGPPHYPPPRLVRFRLGPGGAVTLEPLVHVERDVHFDRGMSAYVEGTSVPTALVSTASSDPHGARIVALPASGGVVTLAGLPVDTLGMTVMGDGDGYAALYLPRGLGKRPWQLARFDAHGRPRGEPTAVSLPFHTAPPSPFDGVIHVSGTFNTFVRTDFRGMPIRPAIHLGSAAGLSAIAWLGDHFLVLTTPPGPDGPVLQARTLTCVPQP